MNKIFVAISVAFIITAFIRCSEKPSAPSLPSIFDMSPNTAVVTYVVDGDTFYCKIDSVEDIVRVLGIDTYEISKGERLYRQVELAGITPDSAFRLGFAAKHFADSILRGKPITLIRDTIEPNKDIYGRFLRWIIIDNMKYDSLIIANGYNAQ